MDILLAVLIIKAIHRETKSVFISTNKHTHLALQSIQVSFSKQQKWQKIPGCPTASCHILLYANQHNFLAVLTHHPENVVR